MNPDAVKRLRWRCRRGMRELDLLLESWLDRHAQDTNSATLEVFAQLLDSTDMELYDWVTGRARPTNSQFAAIIDELTVPRG